MRGSRAGEGEFEGQLKPQAGYRAHLIEVIQAAGAQLVDLPEVADQELVERSLKRQAPFDSSGKRGYRDALIWHNLLEVARSGDSIVFATADGDFREDEMSDRLDKHLIRDLRERGIDPGRVSLVRTLAEVVERVLEPVRYMLDALDDQLVDNPDRVAELAKAITEIATKDSGLVDCTEAAVEADVDGEPFEGKVIEKRVIEIKGFERFALADAVALGEDRFGIKLWMDATVYFEAKVAGEGAADDDPQAEQSSAWVSGRSRARLIYELDYGKSEARLGQPRFIRLISVPDGVSEKRTRAAPRACVGSSWAKRSRPDDPEAGRRGEQVRQPLREHLDRAPALRGLIQPGREPHSGENRRGGPGSGVHTRAIRRPSRGTPGKAPTRQRQLLDAASTAERGCAGRPNPRGSRQGLPLRLDPAVASARPAERPSPACN